MWQAKDQVEQLAGHFPYLVQMACCHYFEDWQDKGTLDESAHARVRLRYEDEATSHFEAVWRRYLSDEERAVLLGVLLGEPLSHPQAAWRLERKGYLADGHIVPAALGEWIRRRECASVDSLAGSAPTPTASAPSEGIWVDKEGGAVYLNGERLDPPLTNKQFQLMRLLHENRKGICTPYMIISAVYSEDYIDEVDDQRIHQLISRLRKRIEPEGRPWRYIVTVHGRGFTLGDGTPMPD